MPAAAAARRRQTDNELAEVSIAELDDQGRGVVREHPRKTLVEGALAGEQVRIRRVRRRRRHDVGEVEKILCASPDRVAPACRHFGICGGCRFQHLSMPGQIERKTDSLMDALSGQGLPPPEHLLEPLYGPATGYRRKARLGVRHVPGKGGALVGFREKRGNFVADIDACPVLVPLLGERIGELRGLISGLDACARIPQLEVAAGENAVAVVLRHLDPLSEHDQHALKDFARTQGLQIFLQPKGPDSVAPLWPPSPPALTYRLPDFELELTFGPMDFVQVNSVVNELMVARAVALLELTADDRVLDLYCGIGNFSLAMARRAHQVLGVESSEAMTGAARANAACNGIENARFRSANLDEADGLDEILNQSWDKLLLDPPRSGASSAVEHLKSPYPARIVYVSCNPESFARDARRLVHDHGYRLERAGIVDMFPHTSHAEVIGAFAPGPR